MDRLMLVRAASALCVVVSLTVDTFADSPTRSGFVVNPMGEAVLIDVPGGTQSLQALSAVYIPDIKAIRADAFSKGILIVGRAHNGVMDVAGPEGSQASVVDRNGDGTPDFVMDRWVFDGKSDGQVDTIVQFLDANQDGRAEQIDFYLGKAQYVVRLPANPAAAEPWEPTRRFTFDEALDGRTDLGPPASRWYDKTGDGTWTHGSILAGGQVSGDWVEHDRDYKLWHGTMRCIRHMDLDGDGDIDIRAFQAENDIQRGANIDGSDQATNVLQTYDLYAGVGFYRWPEVDNESWRDHYGTFSKRKNVNPLDQEFRRRHNLWLPMQDNPHAVYDIDGDGLRDAFLGVAVSGLECVLRDNADGSPYVWQGTEREFIQLAGPGQLNLNIDYNPYKTAPPDDARGLEVKTYTDAWGNRLENFVGAYSPPSDWDGTGIEVLNEDGTAAEWMWQWDWLQTKPLKELYVATWLLDHKGAGEGAAVITGKDNFRVEADHDASSDFSVYHTPLIDWFHLKGTEWGWWMIESPDRAEIQSRYGNVSAEYGLFEANQFRYGNEVMDPDLRRFYADSFGVYYDADGDQYIDTYLLDTDNNGLFDARLWYDHENGQVLFAEGNTFRKAPLKVDFVSERTNLANYPNVRDLYREEMATQKPVLSKTGAFTIEGASEVEPAMRILVDVFHCGEPVQSDKSRSGYSRLFTSLGRRPAAIDTLDGPWTALSFEPASAFVLAGPLQSQPNKQELATLFDWVKTGGRLLVLPGASGQFDSVLADTGIRVDLETKLSDTTKHNLQQYTWGDGSPIDVPFNDEGVYVDQVHPLILSGRSQAVLVRKSREADAVLAAEVSMGTGRVVVVAGPSVIDNRFTAYHPQGVRAFHVPRLANRAFVEWIAERIAPSDDAIVGLMLGKEPFGSR